MTFETYQQFPGALPAGGTTLTSATELAFMTSVPAQVPPAPEGVVIRGTLTVTAGASGTGGTIKCRRGAGVAGTQVGITNTYTQANSATNVIPFSFVDTAAPPPSSASAGIYSVTFTASGANATAVDGAISVVVPDPGGAVN